MKRILAFGATLVAFTLPVAACGEKAGGGNGTGAAASPSPSPSPKPAEVLAKAAAATEGKNLKFTLKFEGETADCVHDATSKGTSITAGTGDEKFEFLFFPGTIYMKNILTSGKFFKIDMSKVKATSDFRVLEDPLFARSFLATATDVKADAAGAYSGTLDLTKVTGAAKQAADVLAKDAGAKATAIPFTATVDAQGRLASFTTTFPGADDGKDMPWELKIQEIGGTATVAQPAPSTVTEFPASEYDDL
ncbi:hypothetical protein Val02_16120 [Virgisporangium aliadipatigenens]|uniref:Lipoprotein n=1 Tax=Virgisporangium aliadipatigenens TaxID=741659 RepID=A0A8J4DPB6_9ACTN|nr:hypothetical protein [Virgisporangium aliadipatigenens]GIJ44726.1 hypothetical protein Val02_16120 [Virgisporangium aliadipatigenens]